MKKTTHIVLILLSVILIQGCSRKKDTFINRNFHALGTRDNILFNGYNALERGRDALADSYKDNFWELLPIERLEVSEDVFLPGQSKNQDFEKAEEKAIKAVQTHGMMIDGKERNPQIDEAYLLLGKARYFDQRFIPSLEAFNYILYKYPASDKINHSKIWREKTNMRLENNEVAKENLIRLLEQEKLDNQDLADANATLAQVYLNIKEIDSALVHLKIAAASTRKKNEKGRFNFIKGQLYNMLNHKDSANMAFDEVIELHRKIPRPYYINAHLAKARNFDYDNGNIIEFQEYLTELEENRENRPFLDKIYHEIGQFHAKIEADSVAERYYNKSLRASRGDKFLNARNYSILGDMYFDRTLYKTAGAYYDSTLTSMMVNTRPYRAIKKKRENLEDVIYYEDIAKVNDSIITLVNYSEDEQLAYFTELTNKLKEEAALREEQAKKDAKEIARLNQNTTDNAATRRADVGGIKGSGQTFYFYNPTIVAFGKNEFIKIWGDRKLQDNWRLSDQRSALATTVTDSVTAIGGDVKQFDPQFYISQIPTEPRVIDSIIKERNFAYYQLGIIYKEKFSEYRLAQSKLENLLTFNPEERLILPSKYNLYRLYELLNETGKAQAIKQDIITNYSESRYAEILLNPELELQRDENSPEAIYNRAFELFDDQKYTEAIALIEEKALIFEGDPILPKFEILKASAKGRLYGLESYKEAINFIALNYPNTEEGKKAQDILANAMPVLEKSEFIDDSEASKFNVIYQFEDENEEEIKNFITTLEEEVEKIRYFDLSVSKDVYNENVTFVVVHGLKSIEGASGFAELLAENLDKNEKPKITKAYFAVSSPNYAIIQRHKNLNAYLKLQ
ncbi:MAG: hypothetical protein KJO96_01390 [Winogradskyella sp.]|nr:hypothetical protein [Winogradskyella sp.]